MMKVLMVDSNILRKRFLRRKSRRRSWPTRKVSRSIQMEITWKPSQSERKKSGLKKNRLESWKMKKKCFKWKNKVDMFKNICF